MKLTEYLWNRKRERRFRPQIEALEDRLAPASYFWTGTLNNFWSVKENWFGSSSPEFETHAELIFPASAHNLVNYNDINPLRLRVVGIDFRGGNYTLNGGEGLVLVGHIRCDAPTRNNTIAQRLALGEEVSALLQITPGSTLTVTGVISGNHGEGIVKDPSSDAAGDLILTANNTYTGQTTVGSGRLIVNGSQPSSNVRVNGGQLGGTGTVGSILASRGSLSLLSVPPVINPGVAAGAAGRLTANGSVTLGSEPARFVVDLNGSTAGTGYDQLRVNGAVLLTNASLTANLNFTPLTAVSFRLIDNDGTDPVVGIFNGLPEGATVQTARGPLRISYRGGTGNDVVLTSSPSTIIIPPSTFSATIQFPDRSVTPVIDEGGTAILTGRIRNPDPHDVFFLEVNWSDGTPTERHVYPPGSDGRTVRLTHRYLDNPSGGPESVYTIQLAWHNQHDEGNSGTLTTTVRNVAPVVHAGGPVVLNPSGILNRLVTFTDPGQDQWTATVNYGDGSAPQTIDVHGGQQFQLHHHYSQPGTYTVMVTVHDDDGGVGTASFFVQVAPSLDAVVGRLAEDD